MLGRSRSIRSSLLQFRFLTMICATFSTISTEAEWSATTHCERRLSFFRSAALTLRRLLLGFASMAASVTARSSTMLTRSLERLLEDENDVV